MIKKLSENKIRQIAAGEVIAKPYNAVKEIIENAIDAKANNIQLYFKEYGLEEIAIIDNGSGINKEELKLAKELHTTSKTTETDQIFGKNSFGFRGEALASIDVISDLTIESNGYKIIGETIQESKIIKGTKISIKNIFKNVPARLKYLKNPQTEFQLVKELIKKFMLTQEEITWQIHVNHKLLWKEEKTNKEERIKAIMKEEAIEKEAENKEIKIRAHILKEQKNIAYMFVNKRNIKDRALFKYIGSLFKEYTFLRENPGYILEIEIDPMYVDYNVHPSKEEVRFLNYPQIFTLLNKIFSMNELATTLNNSGIIFNNLAEESTTQIHYKNQQYQTLSQKTEEQQVKESNEGNETIKNLMFNAPSFQSQLKNYPSKQKQTQEKDDLNLFLNPSYTNLMIDELKEKQSRTPLFKTIGQLQNSYILFENEKGLGIFDQHAAHERKLYEQLKHGLTKNGSQTLLSQISLKLSEEKKIFLRENQQNLENKGIFIENESIIALPILFTNIAELIETLETLTIPCDIETEIDRLLANIACKKALKANTALSIYQMQTLLEESLKNPPICNHGRPVFKYFSNNEIKNFFKR